MSIDLDQAVAFGAAVHASMMLNCPGTGTSAVRHRDRPGFSSSVQIDVFTLTREPLLNTMTADSRARFFERQH